MVAPMTRPVKRRRATLFTVLSFAVVSLFGSCASVQFDRTAPSSGTFTSKAMSFTVFGFDFPSHALLAARGNASDAAQPNTIVKSERVFPHLGPFDWLLDIISFRWATVSGTWGYEDPAGE